MALLVIGCVIAAIPLVLWAMASLRRHEAEEDLPPSGLPPNWWRDFERDLEKYTSGRT